MCLILSIIFRLAIVAPSFITSSLLPIMSSHLLFPSSKVFRLYRSFAASFNLFSTSAIIAQGLRLTHPSLQLFFYSVLHLPMSSPNSLQLSFLSYNNIASLSNTFKFHLLLSLISTSFFTSCIFLLAFPIFWAIPVFYFPPASYCATHFGW